MLIGASLDAERVYLRLVAPLIIEGYIVTEMRSPKDNYLYGWNATREAV